jgi:hypothetical protein
MTVSVPDHGRWALSFPLSRRRPPDGPVPARHPGPPRGFLTASNLARRVVAVPGATVGGHPGGLFLTSATPARAAAGQTFPRRPHMMLGKRRYSVESLMSAFFLATPTGAVKVMLARRGASRLPPRCAGHPHGGLSLTGTTPRPPSHGRTLPAAPHAAPGPRGRRTAWIGRPPSRTSPSGCRRRCLPVAEASHFPREVLEHQVAPTLKSGPGAFTEPAGASSGR